MMLTGGVRWEPSFARGPGVDWTAVEQRTTRTRRPRFVLAVIYALVVGLAGVGTIEWAARGLNRFGYARSASPGLVYELRPEYRDHNEHGYRDREYTKEKRFGVFRIIGIGDSYTYGEAVPLDKVFLRVAEQILNEEGNRPEVEILNFGVPGYNTAMEATLFEERTADWDPDMIVVQYCGNDGNLPNFLWTERNGVVARSFALHGFLRGLDWLWPTFVRKELMGYFFDEGFFPVPGLEHVEMVGGDPLREPADAPERYRYMLGADGVRHGMRRIAAESRRRDIPVIYVFGWGGGDQEIQGWAASEGLYVLDVWPHIVTHLGATGRDLRLAPRDFQELWVKPERDNHPNEEGHGVIGRALADAIRPQLPKP
jgi:lysophospholipase L1-like esterase